MSEKPEKSHEQIYQERIQWATIKAKELGIEFDREKDPEHFQIPFFDGAGKEIGRNLLPIWGKIPLTDSSGNKQKPASIEEAIGAVKKFPSENLYSAVQKLRVETSQK